MFGICLLNECVIVQFYEKNFEDDNVSAKILKVKTNGIIWFLFSARPNPDRATVHDVCSTPVVILVFQSTV